MGIDRRKRLLILVSVACVGAWVADNLIITPMIGLWNARSARIQELTENISKGAGLLEREADLKRRWEEMKGQALPNRQSDAEKMVFESVNRWAGDSRLSVTSLKPRWGRPDQEGQAVAPAQTATARPSGGRPDQDAQVLEIQLEGVGNIEAVTRFVYALEVDPLPLKVEDFEVTAQDEKSGRLNLSLRFTGVVLGEAAS